MSPDLSSTLDRVVENATNQITAARRERFLRSRLGVAVTIGAVVPIAALLLQLIRLWIGLPAGFGFSIPWIIAMMVVLPGVWLIARTLLHRIQITRLRALGQMDLQLDSSERLVTADQFLKRASRDAFMQAAVEDASEWASRARAECLSLSRCPSATNRSLRFLAIPIALLALLAGHWVAGLGGNGAGARGESVASLRSLQAIAAKDSVHDDSEAAVADEKLEESSDKRSSDRRATKRTHPKEVNADATPDNAEESQGQLADGETSESQQSSNPSSARGKPSASGQPSQSDAQTERKRKQRQHREEKSQPKQERDTSDEPSGSTAGQGASRGSSNNAAASDWSSKSQSATPEDEDVEDEDDVDDDDEEQESRGGVQPNMRDRRAPVNRDLQIGFGSNRPNPDANGRGGPSGQKKSRGVASLVLGVPIPDRIAGQPNKGRIRITQQRITPEAEQSEAVAAEDRGERDSAVGPLHHPEFPPWLQNFVRRYFLERRSAHPLTSRSATSDNDA